MMSCILCSKVVAVIYAFKAMQMYLLMAVVFGAPKMRDAYYQKNDAVKPSFEAKFRHSNPLRRRIKLTFFD